MLHWKERTKLCKGGSKSGGGGGGGASSGEAQSAASQPKLPDGVSVNTTSIPGASASFKTYGFKQNGVNVDLTINDMPGQPGAYVGFGVGKGFDMEAFNNRGLLQGKDADTAALKLARIMKHEASTRPDGYKYFTSANADDGFGAMRTLGYMRQGFSRPVGGFEGGKQFAVVKNGRLVPDEAALKKAEKGVYSEDTINKNIQRMKDRVAQDRENRRQNR